jgi:hypothetical protein
MTVPTFLSVTGSPVTTSGTLAVSLSGTALPEVNGGTAQTSYATGDILYASASNTLSKLAIGSTGQVLTVAAGAPTWAAASGGTSYALQPVRVATTANGTLATAYANGQTVDGVTLATGDRILLKNQTTATENGVYTVNASGAPTRATDFTTGAATLTGGAIIPVRAGTLNGGTQWQCSNAAAITIGSTSITFVPTGGVFVSGLGASTAPTNTGIDCVVIGGGATSANIESVVIGKSATMTANSRAVVIGVSATCAGSNGIAIGRTANAGSASNGLAIGYGANAGNGGGTISIGYGANNSGNMAGAMAFSTSPNGGGIPDYPGQILFNTGQFGGAGAAIISFAVGGRTTSDATPVELGIFANVATASPSDRIALTNNSTYIFDCQIVARKSTTGTDYAAFQLTFLINREANAASTALVGTPVATSIAATAGAATWAVAVTADTTNGRPNISVTGQAATTIRWVANIRMTKVSG